MLKAAVGTREELAKRQLKPRQYCAAVHDAVDADDHGFVGRREDLASAFVGVDLPNQFDASIEILVALYEPSPSACY